MATTPKSPSYLPTYETSGGARVTGVTGDFRPDVSGFAAYANSFDRYLGGLEKFNDSLVGVLKTYHGIREKRDMRDTDTLSDKMIRDRKMDSFASSTGKDADGMLEREEKWVAEARDAVIKQSGLSAEMAGDIFDKHAAGYLDRVGSYMLEQNVVAEKNSKFAAAVNAQDNLALSNVGDFRAYAEYSAKVNSIYGPISKEGIEMRAKGIDVMIESWVAQNPRATMQWFNQNKTQLREVMGREFADVGKAMERVQRTLDAQVSRAEVQAQRSQRLADRAQKKADESYLSEGLTALASDDPNFNINQFIKDGQARGISGQALMTMLKASRNEENLDVRKVQTELDGMYYSKAAAGELTDADRQAMFEHVSNGKMTASSVSRITEASSRMGKLEEKGLTPAYKMAVAQLKTSMAPRGAFDPVNPKAQFRFQQTEAALFKYVQSLSTADQKFSALDLTNPKSYINQLIQANKDGRSPADRMMDLTSPVTDVMGWQPALPDMGTPKVDPMRPGETFRDWKARTSGQPVNPR